MIGSEQYQDLEKKIFLQILDFSWRCSPTIFRTVRGQVIGLRSYGQKDPLSEFKKRRLLFLKFLLDKVKTDIIKFLLNMNLVLS